MEFKTSLCYVIPSQNNNSNKAQDGGAEACDLSVFDASLVYVGILGQPRLHHETVSNRTKTKTIKQHQSPKNNKRLKELTEKN